MPRREDHESGLMLQYDLDLDENRGALQLERTFSMYRCCRGQEQVFNGYGESLIDYDASTTRVDVGILPAGLL